MTNVLTMKSAARPVAVAEDRSMRDATCDVSHLAETEKKVWATVRLADAMRTYRTVFSSNDLLGILEVAIVEETRIAAREAQRK